MAGSVCAAATWARARKRSMGVVLMIWQMFSGARRKGKCKMQSAKLKVENERMGVDRLKAEL